MKLFLKSAVLQVPGPNGMAVRLQHGYQTGERVEEVIGTYFLELRKKFVGAMVLDVAVMEVKDDHILQYMQATHYKNPNGVSPKDKEV